MSNGIRDAFDPDVDLPEPQPPPVVVIPPSPDRGPGPGPIGRPSPDRVNPYGEVVAGFLCAQGQEPLYGPSCRELGFYPTPMEPGPAPIPGTPPFVPPTTPPPAPAVPDPGVIGGPPAPGGRVVDRVIETVAVLAEAVGSIFVRGPLWFPRVIRREGSGSFPTPTFPGASVGSLVSAAA